MKLISKIEAAALYLLSYMDIFSDPYKYSKELHSYKPHDTHLVRQEFFKKCLQQYLTEVFGESFDLRKYDIGNESVYSIIDHHDFLNHPSFIFPNIIGNLFRFNKNRISDKLNDKPCDKSRAIISITDSGIPADHFGNRRGMRFNGTQFRFFPYSERHRLSFGASAVTNFNLAEQASVLGFSDEKILFLKEIDSELYDVSQNPKVISFDTQITLTNAALWKRLFSKEFVQYAPELFHVSGEVLVSSMLQTYLKDEHNMFYGILFDKQKREHTIKLFDKISGCWEIHDDYVRTDDISKNGVRKDKGTHFFWAVNNKGNSERLRLEDNVLVNADRTICIGLTPEDIIESLISRRIYPGLFLVYSILVFYSGIKPLTGGRSTEVLIAMKEKWLIMESNQEKTLIQNIPVNNPVQYSYNDDYCLDLIYKNKLSMHNLRRCEVVRLNSARISKIKVLFRKLKGNKI